MAHENIRSNVSSFAIDSDGYFCYFNPTINVLFKTTQTGKVAFTYSSLDSFTYGSYGSIVDVCYDGTNFWTLNREGSSRRNWSAYGGYVYDYAIKKWEIGKDKLLRKTKQFNYVNSNINDVFVPTSFSVEAYHTDFYATVSGNNSYVKMTKYWDSPQLEPGDKLYLGPNKNGNSEYVTVTGTSGQNTVGLTFYTVYKYEQGDKITFNKAIHVFNKFNSTQYGNDTDGTWQILDPLYGTTVARYTDQEYKNITASTFSYIDSLRETPPFYSLVYVKSNSIKFIDINKLSTTMVMDIDNVQANNSTIIPIYDIVVNNGSIYRLQLRSMYYETDYTWSTYNYVLSPIREFVDSIVVSVAPKILPSNGVSLAEVTAIVNNQYSNPINAQPTYFSDDNDTGYITLLSSYTNTLGKATTYYFSGLSPATVTITGKVLAED